MGNVPIPIVLQLGRNGSQLQLNLVYSTDNGNSPLGLGRGLSISSVNRKTWRGLRRYDDATDVIILSDAEDLVPIETSPKVIRYRPRTEGLFGLIERHANSVGYFRLAKCRPHEHLFRVRQDCLGNIGLIIAQSGSQDGRKKTVSHLKYAEKGIKNG